MIHEKNKLLERKYAGGLRERDNRANSRITLPKISNKNYNGDMTASEPIGEISSTN